MIYDCAVIGAGPAGIIATIQLRRSGLSSILFEKKRVGGLLWNANKIENYLGFEEISGPDLTSIFSSQLKSFDPTIIPAQVISIKKTKQIFTTKTQEEEYRSKAVIVATGTLPKKAGIPGEEHLNKAESPKIFYEMYDIPKNYKSNGTAILIGGGDVGFDNALNLKSMGYNPIIVTRNKVSCLKPLKQRANQRGIEYFEDVNPTLIQLIGNQIQLVCKEKQFKGDFILVAVGRKPQLSHAEETGLFLAGDIQNKQYRQVQIAAGDGLKAAMQVTNYLENANK